mmetsp:Transcript_26834/g.36585  ORF Transcript_26834/g.36585 Transcript_26834/m.36585 type:complete len:99 (+) Transcript_26834:152-448(+)
MDYNYRLEYIEFVSKYIDLLYNLAFWTSGCAVYMWNGYSRFFYNHGLCGNIPEVTEFYVAIPFLFTKHFMDKIVVLPLRLYERFVIEDQLGYNKLTGS